MINKKTMVQRCWIKYGIIIIHEVRGYDSICMYTIYSINSAFTFIFDNDIYMLKLYLICNFKFLGTVDV